MNKADDRFHKRNKNSLNALAYFGKRKFDARFLVIYIFSAGAICIGVNFILNSGDMSAYRWWFSIIAGLIIGTGMYFWDLRQSQKTE